MRNTQYMDNLQLQIQLQVRHQGKSPNARRFCYIEHLLVTCITLSLIFMSSGNIFANDKTSTQSKVAVMPAEPLSVSRVEYDGSTLTFKAISNGCTRPDHFMAKHVSREGQCHVEIYRTKPDYCRVVPMPVNVSIKWPLPDSCDIADLRLTNRLLVQNPKTLNPQKQLPAKQKPANQSGDTSGKQSKQ